MAKKEKTETEKKMTKEERAAEMARLQEEAAAEEAAEKEAEAEALKVDRTDDSEEGVLKRLRALEARMDHFAPISKELAEKLTEIGERFFGVGR